LAVGEQSSQTKLKRPFSPFYIGWGKRLFLGISGLVVLYFLAPPALTAGARWLIREDALAPADVVMPLGGDARSLRVRKAATLYQQGLAKKIAVSGVPYTWGFHSRDAAKRYLIVLGVPEADILELNDSWHTRGEALNLAEVMRQHDFKSAIIVTSPYHSRRALYTFRRTAAGFTFYSAPVPAESPEWRPERWWSRRGDMEHTVREVISWGNTLVGGLQ